MKIMVRTLALLVMVLFIGCATTQSGTGGGTTASQTSGEGKMLTDEDFKRLGIQETAGQSR